MPRSSPVRPQGFGFLIAIGALCLSASSLVASSAQEPDPAVISSQANKHGEQSRASSEPDPRMVAFGQRARARWRAQQIVTRRAEAEYQKARLDHEIAELTLILYRGESASSQDLATLEGEISLAESDLRRAEDRVDWATRMHAKGRVSIAQQQSAQLALKKAIFEHEQAKAKRSLLGTFTSARSLKELEADVAGASSYGIAKKSAWELEQSRETELERKVSNTGGSRGNH